MKNIYVDLKKEYEDFFFYILPSSNRKNLDNTSNIKTS